MTLPLCFVHYYNSNDKVAQIWEKSQKTQIQKPVSELYCILVIVHKAYFLLIITLIKKHSRGFRRI